MRAEPGRRLGPFDTLGEGRLDSPPIEDGAMNGTSTRHPPRHSEPAVVRDRHEGGGEWTREPPDRTASG